MPDIITEINVEVSETPVNITVSDVGIQGPKGDSGGAGGGATAGVTGLSISGSNSITGLVNITGAGIVYATLEGQTIVVSGSTVIGAGEINTASNLGNGQGLYSTKVGVDLRFYSISGLTGISISRDGNVVYIDSNLNTGQFYPLSNPNQFCTSGNLYSTGDVLNDRINSLSGQFDLTGGNLSNLINGLSGQLNNTGSNLYGLITNLSGDLENQINNLNFISSFTGVTGISITGGDSLTGKISFTGIGGLQLIQLGNEIRISGGTSTTTSTTDLSGYITTGDASGLFYSITNPSQYATSGNLSDVSGILNSKITLNSVGVSSLNALSGDLNIIAGSNIAVSTGVGSIYISVDVVTSGDILPFIFGNVNIESGSDLSQFIEFSPNFGRIPIIAGQLINDDDNPILGYKISGLSISGFYLNFTDTIDVTGYKFNFIATSGSGFYNFGEAVIDATVDSITNTGSILNDKIIGLSGELQNTGTNLLNLINGLSGQLDITGGQFSNYYLKSNPAQFTNSGNLYSTGSNLYNYIVGLSGKLDLTGSNLYGYLNSNSINLSGNLQTTGSNLRNLIASLSGQLDFTGVAINTISTNTQANAVNLSGNLQTTGSNLRNLIAGLSGQLVFTGVAINTVSTNTQANAVNLSGNIQNTGSSLIGLINGLSGQLNLTGSNLSIKIDNLSGWINTFSKSIILYENGGITTGIYYLPIWRAQFPCTITGIHGLRISGNGGVINARKNFTNFHLPTGLDLIQTGAWYSSGIISNSGYVQGDTLEGVISGLISPLSMTIQIDFIKK